jgi:hypothetical protein
LTDSMTTIERSNNSSNVTENRLAAADEAFHSRRRLLVAVFVAVFTLQSLALFVIWKPFEPLVHVNNAQLLSGGVLCPGDVMLTTYDIHVRDAGVVDIAGTVTRASGKPVIARAPVRLIFPRAMTMTVESLWRLPTHYISPVGGARQWQAGEYVRLTAVTTTSRGGKPVIVEQPFRISDTCDLGE